MLVYWMRWRNKRPFERELSDMGIDEEEEGKEKELQKESRQRDSIYGYNLLLPSNRMN